MTLIYRFLLETAPAEAQKTGNNLLSLLYTFLPFVLIIGVMYFFTIRPAEKREKELKAKLEKIKPGDKVMTIGGIVGELPIFPGMKSHCTPVWRIRCLPLRNQRSAPSSRRIRKLKSKQADIF